MKTLRRILNEERGLILLAAVLLAGLLLITPASAAFSGSGAGSAGDPYQITTTSQWNEMNSYLSSYYKLMNDLDWGGATPGVTGANAGASFTGGFDGNFKTVKNFVIPFSDDVDYPTLGLFGRVASDKPFKNLYVVGATKTMDSTTSGNYFYAGIVFGDRHAQTGATVSNIQVDSTSRITISGGSDNLFLGGISGYDRDESYGYVDCVSLATLSVASSGNNWIGGIMGKSGLNTDLTRCYYGGAMSSSAGTSKRGGLMGATQWEVTIEDCYSDSTKNTYTSGNGEQSGDQKTTTEMKTQGTYSDWTFGSSNWKMSQTAGTFLGYPVWYGYADPVPPPVAGYSVNRTLINTNSYVAFTDTSTNTPTSWLWQWDDGTSNTTTKNSSHQFTTAGYYHPILTSTNTAGSNSTQAETINVNDIPSGISVTAPSNGAVVSSGTTVTVTGTKTGGTSFGDKTFYVGTSHAHDASDSLNFLMSTAGVYDIRFGLLDAEGVEHISTAGAVYLTVTGTVTAAYTHSAEGDFPITITFTDTTADSGTWASSVWNFGDGSSSSSRSPTHQYSAAGTYSASVIWTNTLGASGYYVHNIVITDPNSGIEAPVAGFSANRTTILQGMAVAFTDESTNSPTSWTWHFDGAGAPADQTSENPTFVFNDYNIYDLTHTATNAVGTGSITDTFLIYVYQPVTNVHVTSPATNQTIAVGSTITATGSYSGYGVSPVWCFDNVNWQASNAFTYSSSGTFPVTYRVPDAMGTGHVSTDNIWVTVSGTVVPSFTMNASSGAIPKTILFTDTSTGGTFASALWNFGDGTTSTSQNPSHTYTAIGTYSPSLLWTNTAGASGYVSHNLSITQIAAPTASFNRTPVSGQVPVVVSMTDTSTGSPTSWYWTFGDGTSSTSQNPSHTYSSGGTYTIIMSCANAGGNSGNVMSSVVFTASGTPAPSPGFLNVSFTTATYDPAPSVRFDVYTTMAGIAPPVQAYLGDNLSVCVNTTGITSWYANGYTYNIDGWKVAFYKQKPLQPVGTFSTVVPSTVVPNNDETNYQVQVDTPENMPQVVVTGDYYNASPIYGNNTYELRLLAINNSYVAPMTINDPADEFQWNWGQGLMLVDTALVNVQFAEPYIEYTWIGKGTKNPTVGDIVTSTLHLNSFTGLAGQRVSEELLTISATNVETSTAATDYKSEAVGSSVAGIVNKYTRMGVTVGSFSPITSAQFPVLFEGNNVAATFVWKNAAGGTITSAFDTDNVFFGLTSGSSWQNIPTMQTLDLKVQKYNENTHNWDLLTTTPSFSVYTTSGAVSSPATSVLWDFRNLVGFGSFKANSLTPHTAGGQEPEGKFRALLVSGAGGTIVTSSTLTITSNPINPGNVAEGVGGTMGLTDGFGKILLGFVLALGLGLAGFLLTKDARVFLIAAMAGIGIGFALGLIDLWILIILGIAGAASLLFASGLLGGKGGDGSQPSANTGGGV